MKDVVAEPLLLTSAETGVSSLRVQVWHLASYCETAYDMSADSAHVDPRLARGFHQSRACLNGIMRLVSDI